MEELSLTDYGKFLLSLLFVLGLILLIAQVARKTGFATSLGSVSRKMGTPRRLGLTEVIPVDNKRRLILVRRDDQEHLILLGQNGDLVVESNIQGGGDAKTAELFTLARETVDEEAQR